MMKTVALLMTSILLTAACEDSIRPITNGGNPNDSGGDDPNQKVGDDNCESKLTGIIRDFPDSHPDFHHVACPTENKGIAASTLDAEGKPTAGSVDCYSAHLSEWYRTIPGTNIAFERTIELKDEDGDGLFVYDTDEYFPINGEGFGNDIPAYPDLNYLFTSEFNLNFVYQAGQVFTFRGDDDLWVFINGVLAIDVGGIHLPEEGTVDIDTFNMNTGGGMVPGQKYPMQIFHAERNPSQSNFRIETTISCFTRVVV